MSDFFEIIEQAGDSLLKVSKKGQNGVVNLLMVSRMPKLMANRRKDLMRYCVDE